VKGRRLAGYDCHYDAEKRKLGKPLGKSRFGRLVLIMKFRFVFWDVLTCKIIVDRRFRGTCCLILHGSTSQKTNLNMKYIEQMAHLRNMFETPVLQAQQNWLALTSQNLLFSTDPKDITYRPFKVRLWSRSSFQVWSVEDRSRTSG
jgi:hypothetical protein